ncbi:hypothetical protein M8J77_004410 [Diaphorina citri]|nr:hypothetical protein M8J77_004410 [Diaphorina citri]
MGSQKDVDSKFSHNIVAKRKHQGRKKFGENDRESSLSKGEEEKKKKKKKTKKRRRRNERGRRLRREDEEEIEEEED